MADQDIKIAIATTADTSGVEQTVTGLEQVEEKAKEASSAIENAYTNGNGVPNGSTGFGGMLDSLPAKEKLREENYKLVESEQDLAEAERKQAKAIQDAADVVEAKARVAARALDAQARSVENLSGTMPQTTAQLGAFASQIATGNVRMSDFTQQAPLVLGVINGLKVSTLSFGAVLHTALPEIFVISTIISALVVGYEKVKTAAHDMTTALKNEATATRENAEAKKFMIQKHKELLEEEARGFLADYYKKEADQLERQVKASERINELRGALDNIENRRAQQEVTIAKQRGGDVALAEANALAVELKTGLAGLNGELGVAKQKAGLAQENATAADSAYQTAINTHDSAAKIEKLGVLKDKAEQDDADAKQAFSDTIQKVAAKRGELLTDVEIKFTDKEKEYSDKATTASNKAFDGVNSALKTAVAEGPQAVIENIKVEVGTITTAATTKADEVKTSLDTERTGTVAAIAAVTPKPQDTAAITGAIESLGKAITDQGNAMIAALTAVTAVSNENARRMDAFTQQIQFLLSRIR